MSKQLKCWQFIFSKLQHHTAVMLLYVLDNKGSSPGRKGFFMAVSADGKMNGSIGGGIMEHKWVEVARERLRTAGSGALAGEVRQQVHDKSAAKNQSGMICSGEQTIFIYRLKEEDVETVQQIIASLEQKKNGTLTLTPDGIRFTKNIPANDFHFEMNNEGDWLYREKTGYKDQLYIIGGGHCALALSHLMSTMGFYIHVFDERDGLNTIQQNIYAHEIKIVADFTELGQFIPSGQHQFVVIMTFGYRSDAIALDALIDKQYKYLGLLGSKKKIEKMMSDLRQRGIAESVIQKIHAPVGLPIKSETPEEIAVSIAAEIIRTRREGF